MGGTHGIHKIKNETKVNIKKEMVAGETNKGKNKFEVTIVAQYH